MILEGQQGSTALVEFWPVGVINQVTQIDIDLLYRGGFVMRFLGNFRYNPLANHPQQPELRCFTICIDLAASVRVKLEKTERL